MLRSLGWIKLIFSLIIVTSLLNISNSSSWGNWGPLSTSRISRSSLNNPYLNLTFCEYRSMIFWNWVEHSFKLPNISCLTTTGFTQRTNVLLFSTFCDVILKNLVRNSIIGAPLSSDKSGALSTSMTLKVSQVFKTYCILQLLPNSLEVFWFLRWGYSTKYRLSLISKGKNSVSLICFYY